MSKSRPGSSASSNQTGSTSLTLKGRFFRPLPYATTVALAQLIDGGSVESHLSRGIKTHPERYVRAAESSTRRDQVDSEFGTGVNLPMIDERGAIWADYIEKQEFTKLINPEEESAWIDFQSPEGRESDEESINREHPPPPPSPRDVLAAFSFGEQGPSGARQSRESLIAPDQPIASGSRGRTRPRRVRTEESLRPSTAPAVIPPIPSAHPVYHQAEPGDVEEFIGTSFDPMHALSKQERKRLADPQDSKRRSISFKGIAKRLISKK